MILQGSPTRDVHAAHSNPAPVAGAVGTTPLPGDAILGRFLEYAAGLGLELYPAQEEAIFELLGGQAPVPQHAHRVGQVPGRHRAALQGAGRGQARLLHLPDQGAGQREVLRAVRRLRAGERGPADRRRQQSTARRPSSAARPRSSPTWRCATPAARADYVVMDEFHYYADRERGIAWQMPLITLAEHHLPADVRHAGRHHRHRASAAGVHRPRGGRGARHDRARCRWTSSTARRRCTRPSQS